LIHFYKRNCFTESRDIRWAAEGRKRRRNLET